ncbi:methanol dehydrogenase [Rodentibacter ratti]|uniref:TPM domain-containing protein n=1 Tax=Rodentibacter ratti TaxID=1906745 RepID=UPI0009854C30|nr:YgcG family protein [Rodentibacter ratti]OOF89616.1 methanol dehydrogenase [Rodentibacter ratti]
MTKLLQILKSAVVFIFVFWSTFAAAAQFPPIPNPFRYVNDYTNTLSPQQQQILENKLISYGNATSSQIAVVLVPTTGEYEIADYAFALGDKWGIGRKQLNNGVLMLIAKNDRKVFIATGQGLEGVLPDAFLSQVIRNAILPQFKQAQYAQGINDGLNDIIAASQGEYGAYQMEESEFDKFIPFIMVLVFIAFVVFGEYQYHKDEIYISPNQRDQLNRIVRQSTLSRRRGGGSGFCGGFGGGFGGGGSSGGGFGGGGFGGGGAGGSW